jgi:hypothetical protein
MISNSSVSSRFSAKINRFFGKMFAFLEGIMLSPQSSRRIAVAGALNRNIQGREATGREGDSRV